MISPSSTTNIDTMRNNNSDSGIESGSSPELQVHDEQPMSRTLQYRKVMKPLLERKRRARINKCLDDLKDLMVAALQAEGESITKLEKADVLELTVRHLRKLKRQNALGLTPEATYINKFRAGYTHCAQEVSKFVSHSSGLDVHISTRLLSHLGSCIHSMEALSTPSGVGPVTQSLPPPARLNAPPLPQVLSPEHSKQLATYYSQLFPGISSLTKPSPIKPDIKRLSPNPTSLSPNPASLSPPMKNIGDNYRNMLSQTTSMLSGIDDKAWRPW